MRVVAVRIRMGVSLSEVGRRSKRRGDHGDGPTRAELDAFCDALSTATGLSIVSYAAPRYARLLHRMRMGEVDLAWLAPVVALEALRADVAPLVLPRRGESPWYWSALYVRADSPLSGLGAMHSATMTWVDEESASGHLVMRAALHADGFDVERGFGKQVFAHSHDAVLRSVLRDPLTVGATFLHLDASGSVARAGWGDAEVRELKRAGPIPSDVLAACTTLPMDARLAIQRALCDDPAPELFAAAKTLFGAHDFHAADRAQLAHLAALERYLIRSASFV